MPIGGFLGGLSGLGAVAGGAQQYESNEQQMALRRALLEKSQFDQQQARRNLALQQQQARVMGGALSDPRVAAAFQQQQPQSSPFGGGPMPPMGGAGPAVQAQPLPSPQAQPTPGAMTGRGSWFGSTPGWTDKMSGAQTASGVPLTTPGIALPDRSTLGQNFDVTAPSGKTMTLPQTDVGPAKWTGRGIDINSAAAAKMGYTPKDFPTDQSFTWVKASLDPKQQQQAQAGAQSTISKIPQPMWGRFDPFSLAKIIDETNPDLDPEVKMGVIVGMHNLMSQDGKQQFAEMMQALNYQQRGQHYNVMEGRAAAGEAERERHDVAMEGKPPASTVDPVKQRDIQLFDNLEAAKTPEERKAAQQKIDDWNRAQGKGGGASRSAVGQMRDAFKKEHPEWNEEQVEDALLDYRRLSSIESGFGGGVIGRNVISLNTVADHAQRVRTYFEALNNGQIPRANQIANAISVETGGPEVTDFNTGATIMTGEVTRLLTTTGGAEGDRERMLGLLKPIFSQAQGRGALNVFDDMINARFDALRTQYAQGRPERGEKFDKQFLSPEARKLHESVSKRAGGAPPPQGGGSSVPSSGEIHYDQQGNRVP